jgi:C4-dicarboxylate-specific signal transduction histidine kinase
MKTDNITAAAKTRAHQIATNRAKEQFRSEGRKLREISTGELRSAIARLSSDPEIIAQATADVERWRCAHLTTFVQKRSD